MYKKSQGISINTIIIAAIGLAVLVVLFAIFTGRLGGFTKGVQETDTCAQKCASLNMESGNHPTSDTKSCIIGQYIGGSYSDGQFGCCCVAKP
ncbi:hypothetical protein CMO83_02070 [Candidatus Woesearchaeota archaeon]|jgi:hypothetical protein|nr:hypothetical protein [Candidatus Woesearchaeota archaeon]|tara:strand:+ start:2193 stop:2471 length:279 start_codon:yes stop_codon:yes gene_type:complete